MAPPGSDSTTDDEQGTPPGLVSAVWRGPYIADFGPGVPNVHPGETVDVTPEQAVSDHWEADEAEIKAAQEFQDQLVEEQAEAIAAAEAEAVQIEAAGEEPAQEQAAAPSPPPSGNSGTPPAPSVSGTPPAASEPASGNGKGS